MNEHKIGTYQFNRHTDKTQLSVDNMELAMQIIERQHKHKGVHCIDNPEYFLVQAARRLLDKFPANVGDINVIVNTDQCFTMQHVGNMSNIKKAHQCTRKYLQNCSFEHNCTVSEEEDAPLEADSEESSLQSEDQIREDFQRRNTILTSLAALVEDSNLICLIMRNPQIR